MLTRQDSPVARALVEAGFELAPIPEIVFPECMEDFDPTHQMTRPHTPETAALMDKTDYSGFEIFVDDDDDDSDFYEEE